MFGFFGNKKEPRQLESVDQLQVGDIVSFKDRPPLPLDLQGKDFEVNRVEGYQYSSDNVNSFTLKSADNMVINLSLDDEDGESYLCISRTISRGKVLTLFDEEDFGELWGEQYPNLKVQEVPADLQGWVDELYRQEMKEGTAYFYNRDIRAEPPSDYEDDGSTELRYHECEGDSGNFGLSIEVYEDGDTDVSLQIYLTLDVIADLHPGDADE